MSEWKRTWRATVENFLRELRGSSADARMDAMADALYNVRDRLRQAERQLDVAREEQEQEETAVADCQRREAMARRIGDAETAEVARNFAQVHHDRCAVLRRKASVLEDEAMLLRQELEGMLARYRLEAGADEPRRSGAAPGESDADASAAADQQDG